MNLWSKLDKSFLFKKVGIYIIKNVYGITVSLGFIFQPQPNHSILSSTSFIVYANDSVLFSASFPSTFGAWTACKM